MRPVNRRGRFFTILWWYRTEKQGNRKSTAIKPQNAWARAQTCSFRRMDKLKKIMTMAPLGRFSLTSWHTLLEHSCVHSRTLVILGGCLLPCIGKTDVQWSQIRFNGYEPRVVGSSWRSFPVWRRLVNCSSNCMLMVFIRSTACDVAKESSVTVLESGGHPDTVLTSTFVIWQVQQILWILRRWLKA